MKNVSLVWMIHEASILTQNQEMLSLKLELPNIHHSSPPPVPEAVHVTKETLFLGLLIVIV